MTTKVAWVFEHPYVEADFCKDYTRTLQEVDEGLKVDFYASVEKLLPRINDDYGLFILGLSPKPEESLNALDVIRANNNTEKTPILVISEQASGYKNQLEGRNTPYLEKPLESDALITTVKSLLGN